MELLSLKQVAEELKVSVVTVRRYIASGKLKATKIGKEYRVKNEDLRSLLSTDNETPKEKKRVGSIKHNPSYNFTTTETLQEISSSIAEIAEIEDFIKIRDPHLLPICEDLRAKGVNSVNGFIKLLIEEEYKQTRAAHKKMNQELLSGRMAVFLPLPPNVVRSIDSTIPEGMCFSTEPKQPKHEQHLRAEKLTIENISDVCGKLVGCTSIALDGQRMNGKLLVRSNIAACIPVLSPNLKTIFFHRIPHIPKGQSFNVVDISAYGFEIIHV
ncbi:MAG: hypothetical protein DRP09_11045 [Candidatus Thorarchaeota archaeon]|nr:MAG: hypothetical protein DRP09_11045 [Candidatus Thorarchaeota archaeon]